MMRCSVKNCRDEADVIHVPSGQKLCQKHFEKYTEKKEKKEVLENEEGQ
jgi:hypothetical protein